MTTKTKTIHSFYVDDKEIYGNYEQAKKDTINYLNELPQDKEVSILWTSQTYKWKNSQDISKMPNWMPKKYLETLKNGFYESNNDLNNIFSDNNVNVEKALFLIKNLTVNGELKKSATVAPAKKEPVSVNALEDLLD